jgi:hypothetical protein
VKLECGESRLRLIQYCMDGNSHLSKS